MRSVRSAREGTAPEPTTVPDDSALVAAALEGDAEAGEALVRRYLRKAMAVAIEYVDSREDAEDVVQDAFRSAFAGLDRFDRGRPFGPWFFTILRNGARNRIASGRVRAHEPIPEGYESPVATPFEETHRRELRRAIEDAIEQLPEGQRACFRLCAVEELSAAEAASATGLAESTVRVHVFRARRTLQALLERWRDEAGGG